MQPALHLAADRAQRRGREHALGRAADAEIDVDAAVGPRGRDHAGDVAVADQADAGARLADLRDQLLMARPVEDQRDQIADLDILGPGQIGEVLARRGVDVDHLLGQAAADRDLVHVGVGRVEEAAGAGHRDAGDRVRAAGRGDRGALERIERDVDLGPAARADLLADVEHRRLVALALADHHGALDVEHVERLAHRVDRRLIGRVLVAATHPGRARDRRALGHPHRLEREVAILESDLVRHGSALPLGRAAAAPASYKASIRIIRGGSSTASSAPISARAPVICASAVSCVVRTIGTGSPGLRGPLDQGLDRDLVVAQAGGNVGHDARLVHHHEAKIIGAVVPVHRRDRQRLELRGPAPPNTGGRAPLARSVRSATTAEAVGPPPAPRPE